MIYLDHHATTPVDPQVLAAMLPWFTEKFGNAASRQYRLGWEALDAVEEARRQVAALIGADAREIVFTSGATESNNLALKGLAESYRSRGRHIVTVATEHKSVLDPCKRLERDGCEVTCLGVDTNGELDLEQLRAAIRHDTIVVSVMAASNEIGVVAPLSEIAAIAHDKDVFVHSDAVQAAGKMVFDVDAQGVDLASLTAHKIYGPKGVGALYVRRRGRRVTLAPLHDGGGHERGRRAGTLNVPGIVGFGEAARIALRVGDEERNRLQALRDRLLAKLEAAIPDIVVNGPRTRRLAGNLNVSFPGVDGESLLLRLSEVVAISSGAACSAADPSHVLKAMGRSTDLALATLRFGLGRSTTESDVDAAVVHVADTVSRLRAMVPV